MGGSELEVLESYSLAVTADLTGWLMVVENEDETDRLPAAVGVSVHQMQTTLRQGF
ncbi:MAG TPA: hypothetical protein VKA09_15350 [Nitrososphaeraceae archaeon]|nr:hypothetical protein [Nitrososphaeraceae archaeon]